MRVSDEVSAALAAGSPVVALETTIVSHGLPWPQNLDAAQEFEELLRAEGVVPATIAVLDGVPRVGLDAAGLRRVAQGAGAQGADLQGAGAQGGADMAKASVRDLPILAARGGSAGTTVAATAYLAAAAGVRVFATGGLGGVHRGAAGPTPSFDESADLTTLSRVPVTVVSAGVKSVLDIPATLERLETLGVPVVGFGTRAFPAFWLRESGYELDWAVAEGPEGAAEVARIMAERDALGLDAGILVANPVDAALQWDPAEHDRALAEALAAADAADVRGKAVTPFLLAKVLELSGGRSLEVNLDLVRGNIRVAAAIATAWTLLRADG